MVDRFLAKQKCVSRDVSQVSVYDRMPKLFCIAFLGNFRCRVNERRALRHRCWACGVIGAPAVARCVTTPVNVFVYLLHITDQGRQEETVGAVALTMSETDEDKEKQGMVQERKTHASMLVHQAEEMATLCDYVEYFYDEIDHFCHGNGCFSATNGHGETVSLMDYAIARLEQARGYMETMQGHFEALENVEPSAQTANMCTNYSICKDKFMRLEKTVYALR